MAKGVCGVVYVALKLKPVSEIFDKKNKNNDNNEDDDNDDVDNNDDEDDNEEKSDNFSLAPPHPSSTNNLEKEKHIEIDSGKSK